MLGRGEETRRLAALIAAGRRGEGGALVLRGEAGIGKSALLRHAEYMASGFRVMRASGAEFEMELPYAALHQLCAPVLEHLGALPVRHRGALEVAFGLDTGTPDPFLVGIATLGLLAEAAGDRPLLCAIDDAQWLDQASARALAFLARRVGAEEMVVLAATRPLDGPSDLDGLPGLTVAGLSEDDARALLAAEVRAPLDERVRDRVLAEARGNPLALLELPRGVGLTGMAGGFVPPDAAPLTGRIERGYQARLEQLPEPARQLLTVAAAEPTGDPALLWRAAEILGLDASAAGPAQATSLVEFGARVRFPHPLARSAVYRAADPEQRRAAHRALAAATDPDTDPDRLAWHRALAAAGPDADVAAELQRSAARAWARGGVAAAAAFLERSAALSIDAESRVERGLDAAHAKFDAGAFDVASDLLTGIQTGPLTELHLARIDLLRGRLSFVLHRGGETPTTHVLRAARRFAAVDPARSRACYLDAIEMGVLIGGGLRDIATAAREALPPAPHHSTDTVLDATVALILNSDGRSALRSVVADVHAPVWSRHPSLGMLLATELWDFDAMIGLASHTVTTGRETGSFHALPIGLAMLGAASAHAGDFATAMGMITEGETVADVTGAAPLVYPRVHLAALRGRRDEATQLFAEVLAADQRMTLSVHWANAVVHNGLGDYRTAFESARQAIVDDDLGLTGLALAELVEAAVRCDEPETAAEALDSLTERTRAAATPWGLGVECCARALVTGDEDAYRQAIDRLDGSRTAVQRARAHLLYGEWLRREGRRRDARDHLRTAHESLSSIGSEAFAARAAGELRATGERAQARAPHSYDRLTMQEVHIAQLVATGATTKDVAARLFLSPRTIDAHLRNIFRKLDITSRRELRNLPELQDRPR
ncbi:LuxR family transcriptional regulator [Actinomadura meridiana]|uniref:LuxR family transcriptional regulator n=2 Tax=Actinomadura meridiana TaxID=559626 RepID=A0ABP8C4Z7_9ACTN